MICGCSEGLVASITRIAREVRCGVGSVFWPRRKNACHQPEGTKTQVRGCSSGDFGGRANRSLFVQFPSRAFWLYIRYSNSGRSGGQYRMPRLWIGTHCDGAIQNTWLRDRRMAARNTRAYLAMSSIVALPGLSASGYKRHMLHSEERAWVEKNCYIDIWIEFIHALGLNPLAIMPFTATIDFEDDQWTFFKPPHDELRDLYGIEVQELNVWRPLLEHATEHLAAGRLISTEADAFWLPDTGGTDYRRQHTKSTIVLAELDLPNRRLGYFHNAGYFAARR